MAILALTVSHVPCYAQTARLVSSIRVSCHTSDELGSRRRADVRRRSEMLIATVI